MSGEKYPFGGSVAVLLRLLDAILVGLVGLVVSCVVLRLGHFLSTINLHQLIRLGFLTSCN